MERPTAPQPPATPPAAAPPASAVSSGNDDTVDLELPEGLDELLAGYGPAPADAAPTDPSPTGTALVVPGPAPAAPQGAGRRRTLLTGPDLLDHVADWPASSTPCGLLQLVPVRIERDLRLLTAWMNDPAVAAFWELAGPPGTTAAHLRAQLDGDGRSVPCLGVLDGVPMSYWEIYRADLDRLARYYPARPHDTGLHLLIGSVADRGRGLGSTLLRAVRELVLAHRPGCGRVLAEPDLRNTPSVAAFLGAGFRFSAEVDLPEKRAALMMRDRAQRDDP